MWPPQWKTTKVTFWACSTCGHPGALVLPCLYYIVVQRSHRFWACITPVLQGLGLVLHCITLYYILVESIGCNTMYYKKTICVIQKRCTPLLLGLHHVYTHIKHTLCLFIRCACHGGHGYPPPPLGRQGGARGGAPPLQPPLGSFSALL